MLCYLNGQEFAANKFAPLLAYWYMCQNIKRTPVYDPFKENSVKFSKINKKVLNVSLSLSPSAVLLSSQVPSHILCA